MQVEAKIEKITYLDSETRYAVLLLKTTEGQMIVQMPKDIDGEYKATVSALYQTCGVSTFYVETTDKELVFELQSVDVPF